MKLMLGYFAINGTQQVGLYQPEEERIYPIKGIPALEHVEDMYQAIEVGYPSIIASFQACSSADLISFDKEDVQFLSPFPQLRRNVICLGFNYLDHIGESQSRLGNEINIPEYPIFFSKMALETIGPQGEIDSSSTTELDYEVELAVIIGKKGKNIAKSQVQDYIFGYTIMNDISDRRLQRIHKQYLRGKSLDTFTAIGPYIVPADQIKWPVELDLRSIVNGEVRQNSNTKKLLFDIPTIIQQLSQGFTLLPGDIIATGTPSGVGMGYKPQRFLKCGDTVSCEIENIGMLTNIVK